MLTPAVRDQLVADLVAGAHSDPRVTAAALVGSTARGATDRWSDIDLALRLAPGTEPAAAADQWTARLGNLAQIAAHLDVWSGRTLYRVFLLDDSLQVDLSFWPAEEFASTGEPFTLLFGSANPPQVLIDPEPESLVGWGWLYALHTRSALARGRHWQALQMLDGLRGLIVSLACLRHGLPGHQGRGVDQLPGTLLADLEATLVARPEATLVAAAFTASVHLLLAEACHMDAQLAARLTAPLTALLEPTS